MSSRQEKRNKLIDAQEEAKDRYIDLLGGSKTKSTEEGIDNLSEDIESLDALNKAYDDMIAVEKAVEGFDAKDKDGL